MAGPGGTTDWRGGPAGRDGDVAKLVSAAVVIPAKDMAAVVSAVVSAAAVGGRRGVYGVA